MDLLTRTAKQYYEEKYLSQGNQFFNGVFAESDVDTSASFQLDKLIQDPTAVYYSYRNGQAKTRALQAGVGTIIEPSVLKVQRPITPELRQAATVGIESTAAFTAHHAKKVVDIVDGNTADINMTKNMQAIDVLKDGKFFARGEGDSEIGLDIDFGRDSSLSISYNFGAAGSSFSGMVAAAVEKLLSFGTPGNIVCLPGKNVRAQFGLDAKAKDMMDNNSLNPLLQASMLPETYNGVKGLSFLGQMRSLDMEAPVWVASYNPGVSYKNEAGVITPWVPDNECVFFALDSKLINVNRGIAYVADGGRIDTGAAGENEGFVLMDAHVDQAATTEFIRTQSNHVFVPANPNHTAKVVATF